MSSIWVLQSTKESRNIAEVIISWGFALKYLKSWSSLSSRSWQNIKVSRFWGKILKEILMLSGFYLVGQKKALHATKNSTLKNYSAIVVQTSFPNRLTINPFSEVHYAPILQTLKPLPQIIWDSGLEILLEKI